MCTPPPFLLGVEGAGVGRLSLLLNFYRISVLRSQDLRGWFLRKIRVTFFRGCCSFYIKNKRKSEIFKDKKGLKIFLSFITKNLNQKILAKNLATLKSLKDGMGLRMKNFNIMWFTKDLVYRGV